MANQGHGFTWETAIKEQVFKNTKKYPYTAPFDIPAEDNTFNSSENISIKTACGDKAECGDVMRIFNYKDHIVTMVVVQYEQVTPTQKKIMRIREIALGGAALHAILFGSVTAEEVKGLVDLVHTLPHGPGNDDIRGAVHAEKDRLNAKSGAIRFNPKMDSKGQRRIQCSIVHLTQLLEAHPEMLLSSTTEPLVRGHAICATIESTPRQRNH